MPNEISATQLEMMRAGARNAVRNCMAVSGHDRVFVISDDETQAIGRLLYEAALETGAPATLHLLEEYGERPIVERQLGPEHGVAAEAPGRSEGAGAERQEEAQSVREASGSTAVPARLRGQLASFQPTVTLYAAASRPGELPFRMELRGLLLQEFHVRHGHMPGITPRLMLEGMRADYDAVANITQRVYDIVRVARSIGVTTPDGTDLTAEFDPALRWVPCTGKYSLPGQWGNLPEGETFTCPRTVDGTMVVHLLGDYFSAKYGVLPRPLAITIRGGLATDVEELASEYRSGAAVGGTKGAGRAIADELQAYLDSTPNGRRAGEFAIGTNVSLSALSGNLLQDEKIPGLHIAFGDPYPAETGARWTSKVHVDAIATDCTIMVDGQALMRDGQFVDGAIRSRP
jgi:leucyl aminopeptidase (aminopeptidase T)